jgi:predicted nucleotidyltransferase component of viral defense system
MPDYLHNHKDFAALIKILGEKKGIEPGLVEKDYWIMHVLYGLKQQGFDFELKGGTSLSKGYKIIHRFSEDIDIHIKPPAKFGINENPKNTNQPI